MDPLTLLALANGAVAAVKKGCQLYKDIKGAAGDVKAVLKDLDDQFHKQTAGKPVTREQRKQFEEEKARVEETAKMDPTDTMGGIADKLGAFFEAMDQIEEVFWEQEQKSHQLFENGENVAKVALQRLMIRSRIEAMQVELREMMVYQSPPELGDIWTRFEKMREEMNKEQKILREKKRKAENLRIKRKKELMDKFWLDAMIGMGVIFVLCVFALMMIYIANDRYQKYPKYGSGLFPHSQYVETPNYVYTGR